MMKAKRFHAFSYMKSTSMSDEMSDDNRIFGDRKQTSIQRSDINEGVNVRF